MRLSLFNYHLPKELIAQRPVRPRDHSRLLVLNRKTKKFEHRHFYNVVEYLKAGDVLVLNNSKVFPARLIGHKPTSGKIEIFLLRPINKNTWSCLLGGKNHNAGLLFSVGAQPLARGLGRLRGVITKRLPDGTWQVRFNKSGAALQNAINKFGQAPTPPYIKTRSNLKEYQTVFADKTGSVAAPTAGFHFTKKLLLDLRRKGVQIEYVTLHVGYGTFAPVKTNLIEQHKMHPEFVEVDKATHQRLLKAKQERRRIVAVGTTVVRTLETLPARPIHSQRWINTFIFPGYKFKLVDTMITNFHVPQSTLLMLVSAFATRPMILKAYQAAIQKKYRFYSFGDAMLIV
ncbi:MAG: tRNA preQ1(34) S-adenosylmethionine ribosyltransferase-isomerase QueA [Patescibacteria group bacterium]|jgi:S-adenosylmethionine:tRNA ribosyltransferase-isomerase